jgi:hypothetical protein
LACKRQFVLDLAQKIVDLIPISEDKQLEWKILIEWKRQSGLSVNKWWLQTHSGSFGIMPHHSTDLAFSTDCAAYYPKNFGGLTLFPIKLEAIWLCNL